MLNGPYTHFGIAVFVLLALYVLVMTALDRLSPWKIVVLLLAALSTPLVFARIGSDIGARATLPGGAKVEMWALQAKHAADATKADKAEVDWVARIAIKSAFVLADGCSRWGGVPQEHREELMSYARELDSLASLDTEPRLEKEIATTVERLRKKLDERLKQQRREP